MSDGERIAALEAQVDGIVDELGEQSRDLKIIRSDVHEISKAISNYRGFLAGMLFAVASLAGLIGAGLTLVWHKLVP